jgi:hypothetical protein
MISPVIILRCCHGAKACEVSMSLCSSTGTASLVQLLLHCSVITCRLRGKTTTELTKVILAKPLFWHAVATSVGHALVEVLNSCETLAAWSDTF